MGRAVKGRPQRMEGLQGKALKGRGKQKER